MSCPTDRVHVLNTDLVGAVRVRRVGLRQRQTETETDRDRDRETEGDRERQRETERERKGGRAVDTGTHD